MIFSNLVVKKSLSPNLRMHNLLTKFAKILGICKQFSDNLVNERGNIPRRGPVPKFSDLEVVALSLAAEAESIDSENWLFGCRLQEYKDKIPNLEDAKKVALAYAERVAKDIRADLDALHPAETPKDPS